jgi:hypothetical protein
MIGITRDDIIGAGENSGFELSDEPREDRCFTLQNVLDGEPDMELDVTCIPGGKVCITPNGYDLGELARVRERAEEYARCIGEDAAEVEMPALEVELALEAIREAGKIYGLTPGTSHGFDGHGDAIGLQDSHGHCLICLRFEEDRFIIHPSNPEDGTHTYAFARALAQYVVHEVQVE